jgi:hypothetical protein
MPLVSVQSFTVKDLPEKPALMFLLKGKQKATHLLRSRFNSIVWNGFCGFLSPSFLGFKFQVSGFHLKPET